MNCPHQRGVSMSWLGPPKGVSNCLGCQEPNSVFLDSSVNILRTHVASREFNSEVQFLTVT